MSEKEKENEKKLLPSFDKSTQYDSSFISQRDTRISSDLEVKNAKEKIKIKNIEREAIIKAIDDWIGFVTLKSIGVGSLILGGIEIISPSFFPIVLIPPFTPFTLVGIGLALLTGKKSIAIVKIILDILAKDNEDDNL